MGQKILNEQMLHGGDYNPDQWLDRPDILAKDIELMKEAHVNAVSVGIFAWAALEPEDGVYTFDWLEDVINNLYKNGIYTILATPSGAKPAWMAKEHPEVRRVLDNLHRKPIGGRHNHCFSSPYYRQKVWDMNKNLSERFGKHPGVILWHISNEYSGTCYCEYCQEEFRKWLQEKYGTLENLNKCWWTAFWSHTYTAWDQIDPPMPHGEMSIRGLTLDWRRFTTDRTVDFCAWEKAAIRAGGSDLPVTHNLMEVFEGLNYYKFKDVLDIISWDSYPDWHGPDGNHTAAMKTAFMHDLTRSIKKQPFLLMESTPSTANWRKVWKLKRPGVHELASIQAIAHGSNSVGYFQWRKSRGSAEQFHGAVVGHDGTNNTRVFHEVSRLGERLEAMSNICKTNVKAQVAIIYDWENRWAVHMDSIINSNVNYVDVVQEHYKPFWEMGIPVDVIDMSYDLSNYKLVIAPMLFLQREGIVDKFRAFVANGGTLIGTYWSGVVDENALCFQSFAPHGLHDVFGLYSEEIDALYPGQKNTMMFGDKVYGISDICDVVKLNGAEILATYGQDFYEDEPALTMNAFGKGMAFYLCARAEDNFYRDFYEPLSNLLKLEKALAAELPENVIASVRSDDECEVVFLQNYNDTMQVVELQEYVLDMEAGEETREIVLAPYEVRLLLK